MTDRFIWMDRILYYADGHTAVERQWVPETFCKHDDGECHQENPCHNCPVYQKEST